MRDLAPWAAAAAGGVLSFWTGLHPVMQLLVALMVADVVSGILAGGKTGELDSDIAWVGMRKKALVLILVGVGAVIEPHVGGVPLGAVVAGFYAAQEALSIVENASKLGVPVPQVLRDAMGRISKV